MNIRTLERYNKVTVFKLSIKKEQGTRFVAPAHNRNLVQSLAAESGAAAQYSAAALIMRWFLPSTGMIDLHGKQCIQSMSLTIARFMAVQIHVEVKKNPEFKKWMQTVVWSRINISKNIKPLERSVIISPSAEILFQFFGCLGGRHVLHLFAFIFQAFWLKTWRKNMELLSPS